MGIKSVQNDDNGLRSGESGMRNSPGKAGLRQGEIDNSVPGYFLALEKSSGGGSASMDRHLKGPAHQALRGVRG
jgi:hypothetical protein